MPNIILNFPGDSACCHERLVQPARFCGPDWKRVGCDIDVADGIPDRCDWFGMTGLPNFTGFLTFMAIKYRGAKILWSVDDDFASIPDWSPAKRSPEELMIHDLMKVHADLILVSTPHLATKFADVADKVVVAPNLVDLSRFPAPPEFERDGDGRLSSAFTVKLPIKVVWSGSVTHRGDIDVIEDALHAVLRRFGERELRVIFFGQTPPKSILKEYLNRGVLYQAPVAFGDYRSVMNQIRPDVWLAPLEDCEFNYSKSNLRVLEGFALNAAVCASSVGEYRRVTSGEDGRLCDSTESWVSALSRLIGDHQYRMSLACEGRRRVESEFSWSDRTARRPWDALFSRVFGIEPPPE